MSKQIEYTAGASWFFGANTPSGFVSLFDELFRDDEKRRIYIIKGGPGSGKSTLMKRVAAEAEQAGYGCERAYCSSDPKSLDAVIIPGKNLALADGTPPHALEPRYPGVIEKIIDLGAFRDDEKLRKHADKITKLNDMCSAEHKKCVAFMRAARGAAGDAAKTAERALDKAAARELARELCSKAFSGSGSGGKIRRRFLHAVTEEGVTMFYDTAEKLCSVRTALADEWGAASGAVIEEACGMALSAGYEVIRCLNPLFPEGSPSHLIVPEVGFGLFTVNRYHGTHFPADKKINCSELTDRAALLSRKNRLNFAARAENELIKEASERLARAKSLHDELEKYYIDAARPEELSEFSEELCDKLLS